MVQSSDVRLVTETALEEAFDTELPARLNKTPLRLLGDQFAGVRPGTSVPASLAKVSHTEGATYDGLLGTAGYTALHPNVMYDVAEVNWSDETLYPYSTCFLNMTKANGVATCFDFTTMFEGTHMLISTFKLAGVSQDMRVWIDDMEVRDWYEGTRAAGVLHTDEPIIPCVTDGVIHMININFTHRGIHKVRVAGPSVTGPNNLLFCNYDGKFHKPRKQRTFGVISDSWYDTITAHTGLNAEVELAARMGWNCWNMANGGSGFVNPGLFPGTPMNYAADAVWDTLEQAPPLDFLLLNGSVNDMSYPDADVVAAMEAFFDRWRATPERADTPIVWQGIEPIAYWENILGAPALVTRETLLANTALADPSVIGIIRPALENWVTGTGSTDAPNGTGNQDYLTGSDHVHLSPFGTIWNGAMVHEHLAAIPTWKV